MLPCLHANKTCLKHGGGMEGQTTTDGEHLTQLQQVGAQHGTVWGQAALVRLEDGCPEIPSARCLTRCWRHLTKTFPDSTSKGRCKQFLQLYVLTCVLTRR